MKRLAATAAMLGLSAHAVVARAQTRFETLVKVERRELAGVDLVFNEVHDHPTIALCLGVDTTNVSPSLGLRRVALQRGGLWSSTRHTGGSVDCLELPKSELATGFWLLGRRWQELNGSATETGTIADDPGSAGPAVAPWQLRLGVLATETTDEAAAPPGSRVVVTVSGDFSPSEAESLAATHLGALRASDSVRAPRHHQTTERLSVVEDPRAASPVVHRAWLVPSEMHAPIEIAIAVLAAGDGSRIDTDVIHRRKLATEAVPLRFEYSGNLLVGFTLSVGLRATVDKAQRFVDGALKQMRYTGPSEAEVSRAKRLLVTGLILRMSNTRERAERLTETELARGNAELLAGDIAAYEAVTATAARDATKRFLGDGQACVVEIYPPGYAQDDPSLEGYELHTVQTADTWSTISARFGLRIEIIARDNDLDPRHRLTPGHVLWIRPKHPKAPPTKAK